MDKSAQTAILHTMTTIALQVKKSQPTYSLHRSIITSLFANGDPYNEATIQKRLVVIDSLYSTNASYSYFSFEEMAERIYDLGGNESDARDYFYAIVLGGKDEDGLFKEPYGIQKNLKEGSRQVSLLSKYAYYALMSDKIKYPLGFPIYDKLAREMYPHVMRKLHPRKKFKILPSNMDIKRYVAALNKLRLSLFGKGNTSLFINEMQQYDILDAYLWRMGKINNGNLSLLLSREDYVKFIKNLGLKIKRREGDSDYKSRMEVKYGDGHDFDDYVKKELASRQQPFKGLSNEAYLNELYEHLEYIKKKNK